MGLRTKLQVGESGIARGGLPFRIGHLYTILRNGLYRGEIHHKGQIYTGDHEPVIDQILWDAAQAQLAANAALRRSGKASREPSLLAGLLFDNSGNRMTPSHTGKSGKRYRYYLSNHLIAGSDRPGAGDPGDGLRLSAQELEGHVIAAIATFLVAPQQLIGELYPDGASPAVAGAVMRAAASMGNKIKAHGRAHYETIRALTARVQVDDAVICITLDRQALRGKLNIPSDAAPQGTGSLLQLKVPVELRRIGKEKRLIVADVMPNNRPDAALIKAITRAHQWFDMLKKRSVESITDIAKSERLPRTYVSSIIPLALLSPDITSAILDGTQPIDLNLDKLITVSLPLDWAEQSSVLGFK